MQEIEAESRRLKEESQRLIRRPRDQDRAIALMWEAGLDGTP
jgi:hypothetical protein